MDMHSAMTISFWVGTVIVYMLNGLASHLTQFMNDSDEPAVGVQQKITESHLWFEVLLIQTRQSCSPEEKFSLQVRRSVTVDISLKTDSSCKDRSLYNKIMVGKMHECTVTRVCSTPLSQVVALVGK